MSGNTGLACDGITIRYGGYSAVRDLSFRAPRGRLTGLIGPNGAGKTSTFNACSGLLSPTAGQLALDGRDLSGMSPAARARLGLGRTFQRMELFLDLTVAENVRLGREAAMGGANPIRHVLRSRRDRAEVARVTADAIALCGLEALAETSVSELSTGQRRLVELARVVAGGFTTLLLDEPSSGLDETESERFGAILTQLIRERGLGILLVEHDMALVMGICEYLYVLDFGQLIFEGTAREVRASEVVRAAYLGADDMAGIEAGTTTNAWGEHHAEA